MKAVFRRLKEKYAALPDSGHIDALDGMRALLIFLVAAFHIWQQSWLTPHAVILGQYFSLDPLLRSGYIWVDGMILLSGFLLYLPYASREREEKMPGIGQFYRKRFARIYPSYALNVLFFFFLNLSRYGTARDAAIDLAAHLTFTHTLSYATYYLSPINGALWTVGVEVQFYLIAPFLSRLFRRHPIPTCACMTAAAFIFRAWAAGLRDCGMVFNQLPAFLDVYALGMCGASCFCALRKRIREQDGWNQLFSALLILLAVIFLRTVVYNQSGRQGQDMIRIGQMENRFPLALALTCVMVSLAFAPPFLRFLLGNRVMRFLASVSFHYYMLHQSLAVLIREWRWIPSVSEMPNQAGEFAWQLPYTIVCFLLPLALSAALTWLWEKPLARLILRRKPAPEKEICQKG